MARFADRIDQLSRSVCEGYKRFEGSVVSGYKKLENGAVQGFNRFGDKCVDTLFAREGESTEEAKNRLSGKN